MLTVLLQALYLMLPAYLANMAPVFAKKINLFNYPIDLGVELGGKPLFGKNKTYRGLISGVLVGMLTAYLQLLLTSVGFFNSITLVDYTMWPIIGFLLGFGAIVGDLVESFFKRRVGVAPGKPWIPFDQIDFVLGGVLFLALLYVPPLGVLLTIVIVSPMLHIIVNHIGYFLRIRKERW